MKDKPMPDTKKYRIRAALDFLNEKGRDTLSVRQLRVLLACRKGAQTVRGLAQALNLSRPAISRACDRLQGENLLRRENDKAHGRSVNLHLTSLGAAFAANFE
ncbi:MAG: MarR family transcriptional regulator [Betaproteobacteria bacterium]|nr:MarR family transcriptional regulator [Betaproteobacteria bacterium]